MCQRFSNVSWTKVVYKYNLRLYLIGCQCMSFEFHFGVVLLELFLLLAICLVFIVMTRSRRRYKGALSVFEDALDTVGNGIIYFDKKGRFMSSNARAAEFLPELLVADGDKIFPSGDSGFLHDFLDYLYDHAVECDESILNTLGRSAEKFKDVGFRELILAAGNRYCLVEARKTAMGGTFLILIDVGDIKIQEDRMLLLNQYNYELHQAIQATASGIIVTKPQDETADVVVFANRAFCDFLGVSQQDVLGKDITEIFARIDDEALNEILRLSSENKTGSVEISFKNSDNEESWYDFKLNSVKNARGDLELFVGVLNDVTDSKIRQAELSKAQKLEALGQLSAGVAHDFNNVLSIIDGYSRLTSSLVSDDDKAFSYQEKIQKAGRNGANLVKQMLTFSRHEIVQDSVIDLGETIEEQKTLLSPLLDASIKFRVLTDSQSMIVECPVDTITQILMNLVVNARDAMAQGGALLVESRICPEKTLPQVLKSEGHKPGYACLLVSDTGTGIDKEVLDRIFDPFFTTKEQGKGTGLGLSMVYGLVKQIGGYIDVDSVKGRGTNIHVYFMLSDRKVTKVIQGDLGDIDTLRFDGFTAMVAEDEPDLLELVVGMLEGLGMNVLTAKDGHEALAVQDDYEGQIDLLLTDVVMPELGGIELADLMQDLRPETPVVFMSGYPANAQKNVELADDAVFIPKPINRDDLIQLIYSTLHKSGHSDDESEAQAPRWMSKKDNVSKKEFVR